MNKMRTAIIALICCYLGSGCTTQLDATVTSTAAAIADPSALAVLVPGSGTYSRPISTAVPRAQRFFDQGLRLSWGFYFPEAIASHQEAARLDPTHPMPWWGMAQAMGPNPNSRYARLPDDPKGAGLDAINKARELIASSPAPFGSSGSRA